MRNIVDKVSSLNSGEIALYIDKYGIMHGVKDAAHANQYAAGKIMITDEVTASAGSIKIDGLTIYGAGQDYIYLSKEAADKDIRYIVASDTYKVPAGGSVSVSHKSLTNKEKASAKTCCEMYNEIANA